MQLHNYLDKISQAKYCLEQREQDVLFAMLDSYEELYQTRRATRADRSFWNQFWRQWDFPKLRDARQQAFEDIASDEYSYLIVDNTFRYRNFETTVALDILRCRLNILICIENGFPDLHNELFYDLQQNILHFIEDFDCQPIIDFPTVKPAPQPEKNEIDTPPELPKEIERSPSPKEIEIARSVKKQLEEAIAKTKKKFREQRKVTSQMELPDPQKDELPASHKKTLLAPQKKASSTSREKEPTAPRKKASSTSRKKEPAAPRKKASSTSRKKEPAAPRKKASSTSRKKDNVASRKKALTPSQEMELIERKKELLLLLAKLKNDLSASNENELPASEEKEPHASYEIELTDSNVKEVEVKTGSKMKKLREYLSRPIPKAKEFLRRKALSIWAFLHS